MYMYRSLFVTIIIILKDQVTRIKLNSISNKGKNIAMQILDNTALARENWISWG